MSKKNKAAKKSKKSKQKIQKAVVSAQLKEEENTLRDFRRKAPYIKQILGARGHSFHFYDYLDSYADAFKRIVENAVEEHPTLLGVHEIEKSDTEKFWEPLGYENLTQIFFSIDDAHSDYGKMQDNGQTKIEGGMTAFLDSEGEVRSLITIKRNVRTSMRHPDLKYALKITALLHEIGHVKDLEAGKHINVNDKTMDVIEAEVSANLYALDQMAKMHFVQSFHLLLDGIKDAIPKGGYMAQVGKLVLERLPEYVRWCPKWRRAWGL